MHQLAPAMNIAIAFLFVALVAAELRNLSDLMNGLLGALVATIVWRVLLDLVQD